MVSRLAFFYFFPEDRGSASICTLRFREIFFYSDVPSGAVNSRSGKYGTARYNEASAPDIWEIIPPNLYNGSPVGETTMKRSPLPGETPPLLEFENITVFHGNKKVLDNLSITVCEGEHLAILGPNGAGKSSFIKTITRELYPLADGNESIFRVRGQEVWDVFESEVLPRHRVKRSPVHVHPRNYLPGRRPLRFFLQCRSLQP